MYKFSTIFMIPVCRAERKRVLDRRAMGADPATAAESRNAARSLRVAFAKLDGVRFARDRARAGVRASFAVLFERRSILAANDHRFYPPARGQSSADATDPFRLGADDHDWIGDLHPPRG